MSSFASSALDCAAYVVAGLSVGMVPAGRFDASEMPPDSGTARWNRPVASGDVSSAHTLIAPADWPISVTLPALPPNEAALFFTNFSAWMMSSSAKLPESSAALAPVLSCAMLKKPSGPTR